MCKRCKMWFNMCVPIAVQLGGPYAAAQMCEFLCRGDEVELDCVTCV